MKKSIKITLGLLGITTISAITVGSVISCSNNSSMVSTNSNNSSSSNKQNTNQTNDTSFVPYSDLTKTVTKEPSFDAALADWTNKWNQLTANPKTYLALITNDVNACLSYSCKLTNEDPTSINIGSPKPYANFTLTQSFNNVNVSLNKNNTFNISFNLIANYGYMENKQINPGFNISFNIDLINVTFKPYLFYLYNSAVSSSTSKSQIVYGGEFMNSYTFNIKASVSKLNSMPNNNSTKYIKNIYSSRFQKYSSSPFNETSKSDNNKIPFSSSPFIYSGDVYPWACGIYINSFNNGINFGKQIYPDLNN